MYMLTELLAQGLGQIRIYVLFSVNCFCFITFQNEIKNVFERSNRLMSKSTFGTYFGLESPLSFYIVFFFLIC